MLRYVSGERDRSRCGVADDFGSHSNIVRKQAILLSESAREDHRDFGIKHLQFREDIGAIHDGHDEVEDDQRDLVFQFRLQRIAVRRRVIGLGHRGQVDTQPGRDLALGRDAVGNRASVSVEAVGVPRSNT